MSKKERKAIMQAFLATLLAFAFVTVSGAFVWAHLFNGLEFGDVGTALIMSLINFASIAVGYYLGSSTKGNQQEGDQNV